MREFRTKTLTKTQIGKLKTRKNSRVGPFQSRLHSVLRTSTSSTAFQAPQASGKGQGYRKSLIGAELQKILFYPVD